MKLNRVSVDIPEIFDLIQRSTACHLKHAQTLKQAFEDEEQSDKLFRVLCKCLVLAFSADLKENVYAKKIINFMAVFASTFKLPAAEDNPLEFHPILNNIFEFLFQLSDSSSDSNRYWSCALFNKIFDHLEELTEELYEKVKDCMLQRLKDPKAAIRCQAIRGVYRLQDPFDNENPIITSFCSVLESDFNAKVRQLCLEKIAINKHSLPVILTRIRDTDVNVRLTGLQKLQSIPQLLKVSQRRLILQCGFFDSSEKINNFTASVLAPTWLSCYDNDYLKLMASIRLDACEDDIKTTTRLTESLLTALFKSAPIEKMIQHIAINEDKVIKYEELSWESLLYYRFVIEFLRKSDGFEDHLNKVLPELTQFCQYIKGYFTFIKDYNSLNELQRQFFVRQFFLITKGYDVGDTAGRQCLNSLVHYVIQNEQLSADTAEIVIQNLEKTIFSVVDRSIFVCEIISNIVYGEDLISYDQLEQKENDRKLKVSQLQFEVSSLEDKEKHLAFVERNFVEAERIKEELNTKKKLLEDLKTVQESEEKERKTDVETMIKCLTIAEALLRSPTISKFNAAIATLNSEIIQPAIMHEDDGVKAKALKCYALCCAIDYRTARYGIHIFSGLLFASDLSDVEVLVTSIKITVDILTIYGLALIEKNDEEEASDSLREDEKKVFVGGTSLSDVIQALADHLNSEDELVEEAATTGICVLLLHNRVTSSSLLSRILIKWCNPATENEKVKQTIGLTLDSLTKLSTTHTYFADAVISTIRIIVYAPKNSPLCDVNIDNIIKFMMTLCQMSHQGDQIQSDLAYKICGQMCDKPRVKVNFYLSKILSLLTISKDEARDELLAICDDLNDVIKDSSTLRNVKKFISNLNKHKINLVPIEEETNNA